MLEIWTTHIFDRWFKKLRDRKARMRISARLTRVETGNFGDTKGVGHKVSEMRIDYGPGYRIYYTRLGQMVVVLLVGGDKSTQHDDIKKAIKLAREIQEKNHG